MREGLQFHPMVRTLLLSVCPWTLPRLLTFSDQKILCRIRGYSLELRCYLVMNEITATNGHHQVTAVKESPPDLLRRARWCAPSPWQCWQQGAPGQRRQVTSAQIGCTCRMAVHGTACAVFTCSVVWSAIHVTTRLRTGFGCAQPTTRVYLGRTVLICARCDERSACAS